MDFFRSIASESTLYSWGLALILGIPLLVLVLGEIIERLEHQNSRFVPSLKNLRNLVLPLLSLRLIAQHILGIEPTLLSVRLIETLLWLVFMYNILQILGGMIGYTRLTDKEAVSSDAVETALEQSQTIQIPRVWSELLRMITIVGVLFYVFGVVWGAPMDQVVAALGVGSIVLGFALQDTLSSLVAGLLIAFEKPFSMGHWIQYSTFEGQVVEMNWRTVRLRTRERDVVIIPNSLIGKELSVNYTMLDPLHAELVHVSFSYKHLPNKVKQILLEAVLATPGVIANPPPHIQILDYDYDKYAIDYRIKLYTDSYERVPFIRDEILTRIYYIAQRNHLDVPYDTTIFYHRDGATLDQVDDYPQRLDQLKSIPYFARLDDSTLARLAYGSLFQRYGRQEQIIVQGEEFRGFYILLNGHVELTVKDAYSPESLQQEAYHEAYHEESYQESYRMTTLGSGDFFGENLLHHDQPSLFNGVAVEDTQILFIERQIMLDTIAINPQLSNDMNRLLEERTKLVHRTIKNVQRGRTRRKQNGLNSLPFTDVDHTSGDHVLIENTSGDHASLDHSSIAHIGVDPAGGRDETVQTDSE